MMIVVDLNAWVESVDPRIIIASLGIMGWGLVFHHKGQSGTENFSLWEQCYSCSCFSRSAFMQPIFL